MHIPNDLVVMSRESDKLQQRLRKNFNLSNTDVDIALIEETTRTAHGIYFALRLEWNRVEIRKRWDDIWKRWENYTVKVPQVRDLGLNASSYQLPE